MPNFSAFIAELRRRRVFRVAAFYGGIAFVIIQIIDGTFDLMGVPEWVGRTMVVFMALGFPVSMILAWIFDITPDGIVRTKGASTPLTAGQASSERPENQAPRPIIGNMALGIVTSLAILVAAWSWLGRGDNETSIIRSIAVLPLDNLMGDPEQDYFVEGMHEAIISNLARLGALKVISRTSAMRYKDTDKLMPEIARELNVDAVVEGSVLKAGNRVRITAQLIHGASDEHLWSNDYEGDLTDILSLQKTVARAIAGEIGLALKPEEEAYLASAPQVNPEAYNLYLKGWHFRNLHNASMAVEYLEQAVALDSTFAQAYAVLAYSYAARYGFKFENSLVIVDYGFNLMKQALDKALDLDPAQPDAHTHLGLYQEQKKWEFVAAEASFRRALELDPNNVNARNEYGWFLQRVGRPDEALAEFRRAQELDPLSHLPPWGIAGVYYNTREYNKALEYCQAASELQPGFGDWHANRIKREILMQQGRYAEASDEAVKAGDLFRQLRAEWALGNREKVYSVRDSLRSSGALQQLEQEHPHWSARLYAIMGEQEKALSLLERAYEDTTKERYYPVGLVYYPEFDFLRAAPRFKALMQKMGLTEVFDQYGQRIR